MTSFTIVMGLVVLATPLAHADWQSKIHVKVERPGAAPTEIDGTMHAKKDKQRVDFGKLTTIIDLKHSKAWTIVHDKKSILESDLSSVNTNIPSCGTHEIDECLKKQGFVKAGSEKINGHPCTIYSKETTSPTGKKSVVKLWRPEDAKEVPALKTTATGDHGEIAVETLLTNLKLTAQADSLFALPKGYKSMSVMDMMKAFQKQDGTK